MAKVELELEHELRSTLAADAVLDTACKLETQAQIIETRGRDPGLQGKRKPARSIGKDRMGLKTQAGPVLAHARVKAGRVLQRETADVGAPAGGEPELRARPSASSVNLLCERRQERAAVMVAQPLLELVAGELALGLDDGAFAVCPAGLDWV